ncbi:MAG TPA: 1,2-phenylacetyl-CoA epoxidase subunit PaaD [Candidatus Limnocylindrales bacterium]|jgi:ring-1,2-phenylacetyl-CoA epoxidase subunit PaaD|nr:1,2-phenylacetyl-CoA epoxidase subunit PaaD [Candidatus Limnocylindrales bacterium]
MVITANPSEADVRVALTEVPDPEIPVLSVVDLGIVHRVEVGADGIDVTILPTFVGCPALDIIRTSIADQLGSRFGRPVRVETSFEVPWTSDRISTSGREALRRAGIAPPAAPADVRCPHCSSGDVVMDSAFGPTQCRSLFYCRGCRQPFEALKSV